MAAPRLAKKPSESNPQRSIMYTSGQPRVAVTDYCPDIGLLFRAQCTTVTCLRQGASEYSPSAHVHNGFPSAARTTRHLLSFARACFTQGFRQGIAQAF